MNLEQLRATVTDIQKKNKPSNWYETLNERKKQELEFHNKNRDKNLTETLPQDTYELLHGNKRFYTTVQLSKEYSDNWIQTEAKGKVFLDYACGNGQNALNAAKAGAAMSLGLDISDISVNNAQEAANDLGLSDRTFFLQGDCENTGLPSDSIDVIVCSGMLHHLDLSYAFPELRRILKPGGKILAIEALNYNPLIKLYRMMTPSMRTDWEKNHILSMKDLRFAKHFFNVEEVRFWHVLSFYSVFFAKLGLQSAMLNLFNLVDRVLTRIPGIRLMAWQFTFVLVKPIETKPSTPQSTNRA